ncbi:phosphatidylinositol 4,5-bisphosphate 5-phosphatase A isoform X2 [Coregonus clupeaformis]|uniref:phosphatidylinositol 4,5-bisphosphate 5-phosphatase A isoform X2 n=1 Tax=Coregonus clupeaformis TaxID=59861 RepID=UPI001BE00140|nr:phosphatidylinositol 4,5-bisphosphate 5-phosphatase A isoform X2 [Coregonus clupeaformis]
METLCDQRGDEGRGCEGQTNTGHSSSHSTFASVTHLAQQTAYSTLSLIIALPSVHSLYLTNALPSLPHNLWLLIRLMDQMQQKQSSIDPARLSGQPGLNAFPGPAQDTSITCPIVGSGKLPGLGPVQASGVREMPDQVRPEHVQLGSSPAVPVNISRPRPTALNSSRGPEADTKDKASIPNRIPGPHNPISLSQSPTESSLLSHSLQSPHSFIPQSNLPQPCLTPPSSLSPKPGSSPQPHRTSSPGGAVENQPQTDKTEGETDYGFRVHIVTWNVGSAVPPDDITSLFGPHAGDGSTDMFIIGLQEVNSMINKRLKDALFTDQWSELCMDTLSRFGYVLVASQRMQGVLLLVFSKFCHLPFLRGLQTEKTRTGLGGYWGNKGGVSARMTMFGHPVCFLNCHLPAHMRNLEQRMEDFESILQQQQFEGGTASGVLDHDVVFWFGDLNFRIEDYDIHVVKSAIDSNKLPLLWERDQLNIAKNSESILDGFLEGPLKFPPTYKFDVGTHTYDTSSKKRKPAWTDRILWRLRCTGSPVPTHNATLQRGLTSWLGGATKFPFKVDLPLVTLEYEKEWTKVSDATVRFTVRSNFQRSSWDWVAIYKVGFKHHKDYVAYVWAKADHGSQVTFTEEDLPRDAGEYILGFYSNNMNTIIGVTMPFQIHVPVRSPTATPECRSDSSDVSSEDDSTLVLLAPASSRSPSPGKSKHHHRHRRSRSPAHSNTPMPSLQGLSLHPRPLEGLPSSRSPCSAAKKERLVSPQDTLPSPISPLTPRSPVSPGGGVSAPEALIAAILGEHRPAQVTPTGGRSPGKTGETSL